MRFQSYRPFCAPWRRFSDLDALSRVLESKRFSENGAPTLRSHPTGTRILVLAPHPDDDIFGAGGTLLRSIANGATVHTLCITGGERDPASAVAQQREQETIAVARAAGMSVDFWRLPTRTWRPDAQTDALRRVVASFAPDTIFLPFLADDHPDHRAVSDLFLQALPDVSCEVWAYQVYSTVLPNVIVDITDVLEKKLRLVRMWESQRAHRDWVHYLRGMHAMNSRFLKTNESRFAEMFFVVPAATYRGLCTRYFSV